MTTERDMATLIAGNPMLRACAATTQRSLLEQGELRSFEKDSLLFADDDAGGKAFFLLHGALQMLKTTNRGRRQIVCNPNPTTCEGVCMMFFGPRGLAEVRGVEPGQILIVEREQFELLTRQDPAFCEGAWNGVAHCMAHLHNLVSQLSFNKVAERVVIAPAGRHDQRRRSGAHDAGRPGRQRGHDARGGGALPRRPPGRWLDPSGTRPGHRVAPGEAPAADLSGHHEFRFAGGAPRITMRCAALAGGAPRRPSGQRR